MAYVVRQLHEELSIVPHYHDPLHIDGIQETSCTYIEQDSEWSEQSFMWDRMAWDLGFEGFFHVRTMKRLGTN